MRKAKIITLLCSYANPIKEKGNEEEKEKAGKETRKRGGEMQN